MPEALKLSEEEVADIVGPLALERFRTTPTIRDAALTGVSITPNGEDLTVNALVQAVTTGGNPEKHLLRYEIRGAGQEGLQLYFGGTLNIRDDRTTPSGQSLPPPESLRTIEDYK